MHANMLLSHIPGQPYSSAALLSPELAGNTGRMEDFDRKLMGGVLKRLRKAADITQERMAELTEWEQPRVSKIERGKQEITVQDVSDYAAALGMMPSEIQQAYEAELGVREDAAVYLPRPAPDVRMIPRVGWVQAGLFTEVPEIAPGDVEEWVSTGGKASKYAYALRVTGDSMTNPRGWPSFPDGTVIIVEPRLGYGHGSLVVVQRAGEREATFKRLAQDGGRTYLIPLNPQYPTLEWRNEDRVCGVVTTIAERNLEVA